MQANKSAVSLRVYELNRLCVNDNLPKNSLSRFVSLSMKLLPKPMILVSYADTAQGHIGYIYQATNWIYTGLSAKRTDPVGIGNKHGRHAKWGGELEDRPRKHRYVYIIADKRSRADIMDSLRYSAEPYPKGESKRYDASYSPSTQSPLF